jgi:hypothetical protein
MLIPGIGKNGFGGVGAISGVKQYDFPFVYLSRNRF